MAPASKSCPTSRMPSTGLVARWPAIAYDADYDGDSAEWNCGLMNADGSNQHMIYNPSGDVVAWARSWSPMAAITWHSARSPPGFTIRATGTGPRAMYARLGQCQSQQRSRHDARRS